MKHLLSIAFFAAISSSCLAIPVNYIITEKNYQLNHDTGKMEYTETRSSTVILDKQANTVKYISPANLTYTCNDPKIGQTNFSARFTVANTAFVITGSFKAAKGKKLKGEWLWNNTAYYTKGIMKGALAL